VIIGYGLYIHDIATVHMLLGMVLLHTGDEA